MKVLKMIVLAICAMLTVQLTAAMAQTCRNPATPRPEPVLSDTYITNTRCTTAPISTCTSNGYLTTSCVSGIGWLAFVNGAGVIVTAEHVGPAVVNDIIVEPSLPDRCGTGGCCAAYSEYDCNCDTFGHCQQCWSPLYDWLGRILFRKKLAAKPTLNYDDIAYADAGKNGQDMSLPLLGIGGPSSIPTIPTANQTVQFSGFSGCPNNVGLGGSSGYFVSTVSSVCTSTHCYGNLQQFSGYSVHGDSGSLIVSNDSVHSPIGMLVVTSLSGLFYAIPFARMVADTGLTLTNTAAIVAAAVTGVPDVVNNDTPPSPDPAVVHDQKQMQSVCDDPANQWILKIPHVIKIIPSALIRGGKGGPAIAIIVGYQNQVDDVERKIPPTVGGFPTQVLPDNIELPDSD